MSGSKLPNNFAWTPNPGPQSLALAARWCFELGYGGAKGGGKTSFLLADFAQDVEEFAGEWKGLLVRQTYPELEDIIHRSHSIYPQMGGTYHKGEKTWRWENGAFLKFRHFLSEKDFASQQGHEFSWIGIDEEGNYETDEGHILLTTCIRSGAPRVPKRIRSTFNPGGAGHSWLKARYVDPDPLGFTPMPFSLKGDRERLFIPARVWDNPILLQNDPEYIEILRQLSPELQKAWLYGRWDVVIGGFLPFVVSRHVVPSFNPPTHWMKFRVLDWGHSEPFACTWWAVADGLPVQLPFGGELALPRGALVCYREWYGCDEKRTHKGIGLTNWALGRGILEQTGQTEDIYGTATDSKPFQSTGGKTIAEELAEVGLVVQKVDTSRVNGWAQLRSRMIGENGVPLIYWQEQCRHSVRTLPLLQTNPKNIEDAKEGGEDHLPDTARYASMVRPRVIDAQVQKTSYLKENVTWDAILEQHLRLKNRREAVR